MREAAGVFLDGRQLTYRGEVLTVAAPVAAAIAALMDALARRDDVPTRLKFGRYTLDLTTGWLCDDSGERAHFTASCARLVARLMTSPGSVVSTERVWRCLYAHDKRPRDLPDPKIIAVFLHLVRTVLINGDIGLKIKTVRGYGLRLETLENAA